MKLSISVFALVAATASATSLRKSPSQASIETKVALKGVNGKPSEADKDFIGKALVASYNDVHWEVGHYMTGDHTTEFVGQVCRWCPDDDSATNENFVFSVKAPVGQVCRWCPDDDATMGGLLTTALVEDCAGLCHKEAAAALEVSFCNKIRSSDSAYLSSASECSIEFDIEGGKNHKHTAPASEAVATIDSTLILKGVAGDATTNEELALIAKAFVSAYNDVHFDAGHYLSDAEIPFSAGTPVGQVCRWCPDDDSFGGATTLVLDIVTPVVGQVCRWCPDDDASLDLNNLKTSAFNKKAVELAFCNKIQQSNISKKLSATQSCSIAMESILAVGNKASY